MGIGIGIDIIYELVELLLVIVPVGEMHVSEYKDGVIGLVTRLEHLEINPFRN